LQTRIVEVTVYPDRARVMRRGTVALEPGTHQIEISELPLTLDPSSVRASGKSTAAARLLGVDVRKTFYQETPVAQVKALEDQVQALEDQDKALADKSETLTVQGQFVRSVADKAGEQFARGVAFARTDIDRGSALMTFVAQEMERAQDGVRAIAVQRRELAQQLDKLRKELDGLRGSQGRERYTAIVQVELPSAGELTLDLVYVVANAGWQPLYDLRLSADALELNYLGQVTQRTGEDWNDVALALSTARPALATVLPELKPWYINAYQPPAAPQAMFRAAVMDQAMATGVAAAPAPPMAMMAKVAEPVEMQAVTASVESRGASVTFRLPQTVAIPADGEPHKVIVAIAPLSPKLDYVSVPKLAEFAFRRAQVKNASDLVLLPGLASLFVEGDYIGVTPLKLTAPGEECELYLGVDDRVYIKRELKAREVDKKLLQDKRRLHYGYEVEVRNLRPDRIALEIHDQLPTSRHEMIKVKLESADPRPAEQTELNELTWKLSLEPGAVQFVRFDFSVEHPRDMQVTGLL
jgi:uncharacterized protein (TIGR02231 family)